MQVLFKGGTLPPTSAPNSISRGEGGRVRRVVLDYELKRDYQRFLHERKRGKEDYDGGTLSPK
jgi:hypothetical protein